MTFPKEHRKEELRIKPLEMKPARYQEENNSSDCNDSCKQYESKIVTESELLPYLDEGWDVIKEFRNGKVVIRRKIL